MKRFLVAVVFAAAMTGAALLQQSAAQQPKAKTPPPAAPQGEPAQAAAPPQPGWSARCSSASRGSALECAIEQTAVMTRTGQLIVLVNVRVPGDTRAPVLLVQLPLGLNLTAGAKVQVDDGKSIDLPVQTCEARGCFANTPVAPDLLAAMKSGKQLKVSFQTLAKETIAIPMPLGDFATAYAKIK